MTNRGQIEENSSKPTLTELLARLLSGEYLTSGDLLGQLRFLIYLVVLFLCNIAWVYSIENNERDLQETNKALDEIKSEYNATVSLLETKRRQSRVAQDLTGQGLEAAKVPPFTINTEEEINED